MLWAGSEFSGAAKYLKKPNQPTKQKKPFDFETVFKMFGCVFQLCKSKHCILYRSVERAEPVAVMWPACYLKDLAAA